MYETSELGELGEISNRIGSQMRNEVDKSILDLFDQPGLARMSTPLQTGDSLTFEDIREAAKMMERDPYKIAEEKINTELEKKDLPKFEEILKVFLEERPEYNL